MTGYGRGEYAGATRLYLVEVQAFNHRFLEVRAKVPKRLGAVEYRIHRAVQKRFSRGRFDVSLVEKELGEGPRSLRLRIGLAAEYLQALKRLQEELGLPGQITLELFSSFGNLFEVEEEEELEMAWGEVEIALERALDALEAMRAKEGETLQEELLSRLAIGGEILKRIQERASEVPRLQRERLKARIDALLGGMAVDPLRLEQEVAILADRSDITEEIARLQSHFQQFRSLLVGGGPQGRQLDFLLQEMSREANTMGAKAADAIISQEVVRLKAELERLREQVQNIE